MGPDGDYNATLNSLYDTETQQWFINSEGTIINGGIINYGLDNKDGGVIPGTRIIVWDRYDDGKYDNEKFNFQ